MIIFWSQETVFFCRLLNQHPRAFYSKTPRRKLMTIAISGIKRPNILEMAISHCLYERGVPFFRLATSSQFLRAVHQLGDTYTLAAGLPSLYTLAVRSPMRQGLHSHFPALYRGCHNSLCKVVNEFCCYADGRQSYYPSDSRLSHWGHPVPERRISLSSGGGNASHSATALQSLSGRLLCIS